MPVVKTKGAVSSQGFGEFARSAVSRLYVEDVYSTYLYTGNETSRTITNGLDLSTKGGMIWLKRRSISGNNNVYDTTRGIGSSSSQQLITNSNNAETSETDCVTAVSTSGFTLGNSAVTNTTGENFTSWSFCKTPKFFDIVTYTGDDNANRMISHSLGVTPGFVLLKSRNDGGGAVWDWRANHISTGTSGGRFNTSAAFTSGQYNNANTATQFSVTPANSTGVTYVAYLWAHDATTNGVIQCGSYTGNGSATGPVVTLGWEPQWLLIKRTDSTGGDWGMFDNMRGMFVSGNDARLNANLSSSEETNNPYVGPSATGFFLKTTNINFNANGGNYIYVAIRRGPMKTPTSGTSVFSPNAFNAVADTYQTTNFPIDWQITADRTGAADKRNYSRLAGVSTPGTSAGRYLSTNTTDAEAAGGSLTNGWDNTGFRVPSSYASTPFVGWNFGRAPGFFDQVCYTGTGSATTFSHNLGVVPEMMIVKRRNGIASWVVYTAATGNNVALNLNSNGTGTTGNDEWNTTTPTASVFSVGTAGNSNASGGTFINYLFATVAGVSKVGSYTGTGATQTISCGFTGGARFVLIKRTDSTGNWWVWDTSRGMVAGTDPRLLLNDTNAETNNNWVYTVSTGFQIVTADATVNANGGSYIYLAIA